MLRADGRSGRELKELWPELLARPVLRDILGPDARPTEPVRAWPIPTRYDPARLANGRVLFVGDAAGVVDPMTGEGIAQALETGMLAAEAIAAGGDARRGRRALPPHGRPRARPRPAVRVGAADAAALPARRARRDRRRRAHAVDPPQLRPLDVRGLSRARCSSRPTAGAAARSRHRARTGCHDDRPPDRRSATRRAAEHGEWQIRGLDRDEPRRHLEAHPRLRRARRLHARRRLVHRRRRRPHASR